MAKSELVGLGCRKNQVDGEVVIGTLRAKAQGLGVIYWSLIKGPLSLMNACTAFLGYSAGVYLYGGISLSSDLSCGIFLFLIIFVLSGGAAILNNYQDRRIDSQMTRTRHRPFPLGLVSAGHALPLALSQIIIAIVGLTVVSASLPAVVIALTALVFYNGLYTPLKKRTLLAFIPGLISGSLPPIIGWVTSGGPISLPILSYMGAVLILWQIPHYGLLLLSESEDNKNQVLPSFYYYFPRKKLVNLTATLIVCYLLLILWIPLGLFEKPDSMVSLAVLLSIVSIYIMSLVIVFFYFLKRREGARRGKSAFLAFTICSFFFFLFLSFYFYADTYLVVPVI